MPRVKNGVAHHARKKKIMEAAKGARGGRSKLYKAAKETAERAMRYAYRDRRKKKGEFRALWITRINAAARIQGMSYSRLMAGLRKEASTSTGRSWPTWPCTISTPSPRSPGWPRAPIANNRVGPHSGRTRPCASTVISPDGAVRTGRAAPSA